MYGKGDGVPQDSEEAVEWYRLAAEQAYASGQFNLGVMYEQKLGVPQKFVYAHLWLNIAAINSADKGNKKELKIK